MPDDMTSRRDDAFAHAECKVDQHVRIFFKYLVRGCVCHKIPILHRSCRTAKILQEVCISLARSPMSIGYTPVKHEVQNFSSAMPVASIMPSKERRSEERRVGK